MIPSRSWAYGRWHYQLGQEELDRLSSSASAAGSVPASALRTVASWKLSASASGAVPFCRRRLRTAPATALAAAVIIEAPATLGQRRWRGLPGSIRCAAEDSTEEIFGAMRSCTRCPVRSSCGAAQARVVRTPCFAIALVLRPTGFRLPAACRARASALSARWLLFIPDTYLRDANSPDYFCFPNCA